LTWVGGLLRRRRARILGGAAAVALMVALIGSLGQFFASSRARMTSQAIADVPVSWQMQLAPGTQPDSVMNVVRAARGVQTVAPVGYARVPALVATRSGSVHETGAGVALGIPPGYARAFPGEMRALVGTDEGVLLAQQTAANLHATTGTRVEVRLPAGGARTFVVAGVVDLPQADPMFQTVGAPPGSGATAPPDNVMLLPLDEWRRVFAPLAPRFPRAIFTELHVRLANDLPPDPGTAFAEVQGRARNLEAKLAGAARIADNVAARLDAARADAVYAQLLFGFLGLPGVVLAVLLMIAIGAAGRERRRADHALLRLRGASAARVLRLSAAEGATAAIFGVAIGVVAVLMRASTNGGGAFWIVAASLVGFLTAVVAFVAPDLREARTETVRASRAVVGDARTPMVLRAKLDVVLLAAGGLVYWRAVRSGYRVVLAPEGIPTISVDYFTLLAPLFFWLGGALLVWRLARGVLARGRRVIAAAVRPVARGIAGTVAATLSRQRRLVARTAVMAALAVSFAVSTGVFDATYAKQARVDAQLTNGADVTIATTRLEGLPPDLLTRARATNGVAAAEPMQHRFAYVGADLQDLYGIDPAAFGRAAPLSNAYFDGRSARDVLARLVTTRDGILVSDETVKDFQLTLGDTVRLRLQFASDHLYHPVPFRYIGIAREFPTAPHDSFLIANAGYVAEATGAPGAQDILVRARTDPHALAQRLASLVPPGAAAKITDITTQTRSTLSGLVAVDLAGLTRIELTLGILLAIAASGVMLAMGLAERKRSFSVLRALGAAPRALASFAWSESSFVALTGILLGALAGGTIALVLVKTLTGVFDPPPDRLTFPAAYIGILVAAVAGASGIAASWSVRAAKRGEAVFRGE
jgi:putative ABC transport system permease protein